MAEFYGIGLIIAFVLAIVLFIIEGKDGQIELVAPISLFSWISVVLIVCRLISIIFKE